MRRWMIGPVFASFFALLAGCQSEPPAEAPDGRPNVVVVVLDAARADHFGMYGYDRDTTPHLDRFASQATVFEDATSEAAFTFGSVASFMLGMPPAQSGFLNPRPIRGTGPTLAERARSSGYRTFAYSENGFVSPAFGFQAGFEHFVEGQPAAHRGAKGKDFEHADSLRAIDDALTWMGQDSKRPFFAYVHLLRPHNPYTPSEPYLGRFGPVFDSVSGSTEELLKIDAGELGLTPQEQAAWIARYDENLAEADAQFGRLWQGLQDKGLAENTVVVFFSDHGEAFGEHGRWLHNSTVFDEMIRIPMVIRHPWRPEGRRARGAVQLVDLHATLIELMNAGTAPLAGRSFLGALVGEELQAKRPATSWTVPAIGQLGVRSPEWKAIGSVVGRGESVQVYDLTSDPEELSPRSSEMDRDQAMLRVLDEQRRLSRNRSLLAQPAEAIDPAVLEQLQRLGYLR
ncbi:MAG: sulfatase [Planctomycetota bacterium]